MTNRSDLDARTVKGIAQRIIYLRDAKRVLKENEFIGNIAIHYREAECVVDTMIANAIFDALRCLPVDAEALQNSAIEILNAQLRRDEKKLKEFVDDEPSF